MINPFKKLRKNKQFQAYCDGYSKGYQAGINKCSLDRRGVILRVKTSDVTLLSQMEKRPKRNVLYFPWYEGFELGYTEAIGWYNSGEDPKWPDESIDDMIKRLQQEFDKGSW